MKTTASSASFIGLGALLFLSALWSMLILGKDTLNIDQIDWLWGDLAQVYLSWKLYLSDPNSHWLMSSRMSYPLEMNISLFDPMPILLLLIGGLSDLFPDGQYIGLYFATCVVLQGFFGYLITNEVIKSKQGPNHWKEIIKISGGCLFILTPYTYWRFQGHTALSSQWLLVLSIWVSLRTLHSNTHRWLLANCTTLFIISGFNPYLALMAGLSMGVLAIASPGNSSFGSRALKLSALGFSAAVGFYIFGFLGAASVQGGGYGGYSMNILGPLDSNGLAFFLPIDVPDATSGQTFEGFSYLGMGLILMILMTAALILIKHPDDPPIRSFALPILLVIAASYLLALSTTITLSEFKLRLPAPDFAEAILSRFRASGRLFWIGSFWLIVVGIAAITTKISPNKSAPLLCALLLIQVADVYPIAAKIRNSLSQNKHLEISKPDLDLVPKGTSKIMVFPPWQCALGSSPGGIRNYEIFGFLAAELNASTNNFYAARTLIDQKKYHCNFSKFPNNISPGSVYFLSEKFFQSFEFQLKEKLICNKSNGLGDTIICSPKVQYGDSSNDNP